MVFHIWNETFKAKRDHHATVPVIMGLRTLAALRLATLNLGFPQTSYLNESNTEILKGKVVEVEGLIRNGLFDVEGEKNETESNTRTGF